jgi:hypothetical protein
MKRNSSLVTTARLGMPPDFYPPAGRASGVTSHRILLAGLDPDLDPLLNGLLDQDSDM